MSPTPAEAAIVVVTMERRRSEGRLAMERAVGAEARLGGRPPPRSPAPLVGICRGASVALVGVDVEGKAAVAGALVGGVDPEASPGAPIDDRRGAGAATGMAVAVDAGSSGPSRGATGIGHGAGPVARPGRLVSIARRNVALVMLLGRTCAHAILVCAG